MNYIKDHQEIVHAVRNVKCCVELPVKSNLFSCPEEISSNIRTIDIFLYKSRQL